jgi:hypothetical protein
MVKPDWDVFKAKFSDNPQFHFEWFCYLLFCKEFSKPFGVFRYKNQSAIETNPIPIDGHNIGFQSKFYTTTLSSNKSDLINALQKAKRDYPELTKFQLYTNQEWSQQYAKGKAGKTAAQQEIEAKACELKIELEWRTAGFFESPFVSEQCKDIGKYFFTNNDSLLDIVNSQERHTISILNNIKHSIPFNGQDITIERASVFESLKSSPTQVSIVCGKGGIGKTVEIKKFYQEFSGDFPIFAFKANEFELKKLDDLFVKGSVTGFLSFFGDSKDRVLIIDSAEKLMDLSNQEAIQEFIDLSIKFGWRVIFTTREHYFDDLNHLCLEVLNVIPNKLYISELSENELEDIANKFDFKLPNAPRLRNLLKIPFYLNTFLKFYDDRTKQPTDMPKFKEHLWNKKIKNGDIKREIVFSELALQRANGGKFYLSVTNTDIVAAEALANDEVLGKYGSSFFISHDIYEEWALEKFINVSFKNKFSATEFFAAIGQSLAIRRSFRLWLSEKLYENESEIFGFIESTLDDVAIELIWKDELITAILLSDYSFRFFDSFKSELLQDKLVLLQRVCFILRIACKEMDNSLLKSLGIQPNDILYLTVPKGAGWSSFIDFVYDNRVQIRIANIKLFIPALKEWNISVKQGGTTRKASLLCLEYYKFLESEHFHLDHGKFADSIVSTIASGANEIRTELTHLIDEICEQKNKTNNFCYERLTKCILIDLEGLNIAKALPDKTLELANYCWLQKNESEKHFHRHENAEYIFGVTDNSHFNYNPESALQTPIFYMLRFNIKATVDFVITFINKVTLNLVNHYGKENFSTTELTVDGENNKIYLDQNLWGAYRGAGNGPDLINSILMALEKFFLENSEYFKDDNLEAWLKYILKKTNSSAICGVVSSIVIAHKDKLFNVAKILFEVKEFIQFDLARTVFDSMQKSQLESIANMIGGFEHGKMFHDERIKACDLSHRSSNLEKIFRDYQFFVVEGELNDLEFSERQNWLWGMLDKYYKETEKSDDSEDLKLWRLALARMDRRKMKVTTEVVGDKIAINFNPEIEPDIKLISESHQKKQEHDYKYVPLNHWAYSKLEQNDAYKKYQQYEFSPQQAMNDLREFTDILMDELNPPTRDFVLLNRSVHINAAAALIKYHLEIITKDDVLFCIDIIEDCLKQLFDEEYRYQAGDGMQTCFSIIPDIFKTQTDIRPLLKVFLIAGLFRTDSISMMGSNRFNTFAIQAITSLWNDFDDDVQSIYIGYLLLYPLYLELIDKIRKENYKNRQFSSRISGLWQRLVEENKNILEDIETNEIFAKYNVDYTNLDLQTKSVALYLIPNESNNWSRKAFKDLVQISVTTILTEDSDTSNDFESKKAFLRKYAYYILLCPIHDLTDLLAPFLESFNLSEGTSDLLEEIIYAQDSVASYDNFWMIWEILKPKIVQFSQNNYSHYRFEKIAKAYLFSVHWKQDAKSWHTLKDKNRRFFSEMADKLARTSSTLSSFVKLLNGIGSEYTSEGMQWVARIISSNSKLSDKDFKDDTIYHLTVFMRKYLYRARADVRQSPELMMKTLIILDFLVERGEVSGYLMRESIV